VQRSVATVGQPGDRPSAAVGDRPEVPVDVWHDIVEDVPLVEDRPVVAVVPLRVHTVGHDDDQRVARILLYERVDHRLDASERHPRRLIASASV
jgi:hypothetical protein